MVSAGPTYLVTPKELTEAVAGSSDFVSPAKSPITVVVKTHLITPAE